MLMLIIISLLSSLWGLIVLYKTLSRNYRAHQFFKSKAPNLPVIPKPNIFAGHALSVCLPDKNWKIIEDLHETMGPTFGFYMCEQPWVSTKDLDLIKLVEIDQGHLHVNRAFLGLPFSEFNASIWHNDDELWKQVRRVIAPALTNLKIRSDEVTLDIESVVDQLANAMELRSKKARQATLGQSGSFIFEARDLAQRFTLAVIFLITYKQADVIDFDADHDDWVDHMNRAARQICGPLTYLGMGCPDMRPHCEWMNQFTASGTMQKKIKKFIERATQLNRKARELHAAQKQQQQQDESKPLHCIGIDMETGEVVKNFSQIAKQGNFKRSLVDTIIDSFFQRKIRYENFVGSLFMMLLAGFTTTADTLSCLLWHLAKNHDTQEKLRRAIIEEGIDANYLVWSIYEAVRYHPAVPLGTGRILGADVNVNGTFLPKGTFVMPTTHGIHHDPKIWPEPERFNPDRWSDQASFHPAQFVGFGLGARNCVGAKLALHELKLVIKMLMTNYRVDVCEGTPQEWHFSTPGLVFTLHDNPVNVKFTPLREGATMAA